MSGVLAILPLGFEIQSLYGSLITPAYPKAATIDWQADDLP